MNENNIKEIIKILNNIYDYSNNCLLPKQAGFIKYSIGNIFELLGIKEKLDE